MTTLVASVALGLAGCETSDGGDGNGDNQTSPTPPPPTTQSQPEALPAAGVPKVRNPITNTDAARRAPCSLLSKPRLVEWLGHVSKPREDLTYPAGPQCDWSGNGGSGITITWLTANKRGLTDIYAQRPKYKKFEPTTVDGYPAVANTDSATTGLLCSVAIGVTDQLAVDVETTVAEYKAAKMDLCQDAAEPVAKVVMENIKKQGS